MSHHRDCEPGCKASPTVADAAFPRVTIEETPDGLTAHETIDSAIARVTRTYAAAKDDAIRRQLVALGWTPPGDPAAPEASREDVATTLRPHVLARKEGPFDMVRVVCTCGNWAASSPNGDTWTEFAAHQADALRDRFVIFEKAAS